MAEYLDNLLSGYSLFNITVQGTKCSLLCTVILPAHASDLLYCLQHQRDHHNCDQCQPYIGIQHQAEGSDDTDQTGDHLYYSIIQHFPYCIHIIGETAHQIAVVIGIVISDRQLLHLLEQLITQFLDRILGNTDHDLLLHILRQCSDQIYHKHHKDTL